MSYEIKYTPDGDPYIVKDGILQIPTHDDLNPDFIIFLAWNAQQQTSLDYTTPITPTPKPPKTQEVFSVPVVAPDFIVASPKVNDDPKKALEEAIAEAEKTGGKSIAFIVLSLTKYLKSIK